MPHNVTATTLKKVMDEPAPPVVIDVLSPVSYARSHLPTAVNVPLEADDFDDRVRVAAPDTRAPVVVYCASTQCQLSPRAAARLERLGYTNVSDFVAGLAGWMDAGFETASQQEDTHG